METSETETPAGMRNGCAICWYTFAGRGSRRMRSGWSRRNVFQSVSNRDWRRPKFWKGCCWTGLVSKGLNGPATGSCGRTVSVRCRSRGSGGLEERRSAGHDEAGAVDVLIRDDASVLALEFVYRSDDITVWLVHRTLAVMDREHFAAWLRGSHDLVIDDLSGARQGKPGT